MMESAATDARRPQLPLPLHRVPVHSPEINCLLKLILLHAPPDETDVGYGRFSAATAPAETLGRASDDDDSLDGGFSSENEGNTRKDNETAPPLSVAGRSGGRATSARPKKDAAAAVDFGTGPTLTLLVPGSDDGQNETILRISTGLLPGRLRRGTDEKIRAVASALLSVDGNVGVILLRSGRLAAGIFRPTAEGYACTVHTTSARYTSRRGQGGAQSSNDNKRANKAKSVGSSLRRAGEKALEEDVEKFLRENAGVIRACRTVLLGVPAGKMRGTLWACAARAAAGAPGRDPALDAAEADGEGGRVFYGPLDT